jgi:hypothetical protein
MKTFPIRLSGATAFALVLTLTFTGSAGAQPVTISGSGTISHWLHFEGTLPAALETAFPPGAPFAATLTYDPSLVYLVTSLNPTQVAHWGAVTDLSASAAGHAISHTAAGGPAYVFDDDPQGGVLADAIQGDAPVTVDGSTTLAGLQVRGAVISVFNMDGTPLSSLALPARVCSAAWQNLSLVLKLIDPASGALYQLATRGTPDRSIDSDGDGVADGVELLHACVNACAGDTDVDGDAVLDRTEITGAGTDPCSPDTDGDGVSDGIDPHPLVPGLSSDELVELTRGTASDVLAVPEAAFAGPNASAERGRRNALANRLHAAANAIQAGDFDQALSILEHVLDLLDGDPVPPDVMDDGPAKDAVREEVERLIALVGAGRAR